MRLDDVVGVAYNYVDFLKYFLLSLVFCLHIPDY